VSAAGQHPHRESVAVTGTGIRRSRLAGVYAPICTPFTQGEELDAGALRDNLARYAEAGIHGYLALGSNGENRSLTEEERLEVLDLVVRHKGEGQVVMAGATYDAQRQAERFVAAAADLGADFALVLSPGYFRKQMTPEVLYRYFSTLAEGAAIPLLVYNAPGFNGMDLDADLVARLSSHPNIVGMKDSAPSGIERFLALQRSDFDVLAGSANFLFPAMLAGSPGGTVSLANAFPAVALRLHAYGDARDEGAGRPYQDWVSTVNKAISGTYGVPGVKAAMDLAGYVGGVPRRPLLPLGQQERESLRAYLAGEGLLR
jgi:4-hydroxy-2-oxoglutarate aldolase